MNEPNTSGPDQEQSGMKAIIIFLIISPIFVLIIGLIFVAQVNNMASVPPPNNDDGASGNNVTSAPANLPPPSKYSSCVACHGDKAQGVKNETVKGPRLAGLSAWYMKRQIEKFKDGKRGAHADDKMGAQMVPFAKMLATEADVDEVIAEIEKLKPETPADRGPGDAAKGQASLMVCKTCHGQNMEGNEQLKGPPIKQQHAWYLYDAIKNFKAGIRGGQNDTMEAQQMRAMCMTLATDDAINDVIAAIQALNKD